MSEPFGIFPAGLLLEYFLEEVGPVIYNKAIADAQTRVQQRVVDLPGELFEDVFQYWPRTTATTNADGRSRRLQTANAPLQGQRPDSYQPRPKA